MIDFKNLTFSYGRKKPAVFADFNFKMEQGRIYGLLGKNGAGKSTMLYLMTGLLTPQRGEVDLDGKNVRKRYPETLRRMFLVPEEFDLPRVSLEKYIDCNACFYPNFSKDDMYKYLEYFDMKQVDNLKALSMGQKKKVFISFALATHTDLLIMDEPTNGLDIPSKSQFRKLMVSEIDDSRFIIISTHQVRDIDKILDHVMILDENEIVLNNSISEITNKLLFVEGAKEGDYKPEEIIYRLPSVVGDSLLLENKYGEDSDLNLETLFDGVINNKAYIKSLFADDNDVKA